MNEYSDLFRVQLFLNKPSEYSSTRYNCFTPNRIGTIGKTQVRTLVTLGVGRINENIVLCCRCRRVAAAVLFTLSHCCRCRDHIWKGFCVCNVVILFSFSGICHLSFFFSFCSFLTLFLPTPRVTRVRTWVFPIRFKWSQDRDSANRVMVVVRSTMRPRLVTCCQNRKTC